MVKAYYHLPGLFEFYELYRVFLPLYRETGTGFMTGVKSVRSMELRQIVSGAADVPVLERMIRKKFWH